jgi:anti-anti-sigma regulatory factor
MSAQAKEDPRVEQILEAIMRLASGNLKTRTPPSDRGDEFDAIISGLNMLGEELSASIEAEIKIKEELELRVKQRTAELEEKMETIAAQSTTILELSTPVIGIWDKILILPLIGTIDTRRAQQIIDNLLEAIVNSQASAVIMDITGVPVVDTKVANHFLKSVEAARMLGAEVILTGVSPHNAQTLVKLGVELERITTKGSLQAGLKLALQITNHRILKDG